MNTHNKNTAQEPGCLLYVVILVIFGLMFFWFSVQNSDAQTPTIQYKLISDSSLRLLPDIKPNVVKTFEIKPHTERLYLLEIDTAANVPLMAKLLVYPKFKFMIVDDGVLPGWTKWSQPKFYKQTFSVAHNAAAGPISFTYIGDNLEIWGERYPFHGIMRITVDNRPPVEIDCYYNLREEKPFRTYAVSLPYGSHTVKIENTGKKNPSSTGYDIVLDFIVYRALNSQ